MLELALPLLEDAAGAPITGVVGASDPLLAVREALADGDFHDVIISTLPARVSHWLRRDLPSRVERLGLPVTVVIAQERRGSSTHRSICASRRRCPATRSDV